MKQDCEREKRTESKELAKVDRQVSDKHEEAESDGGRPTERTELSDTWIVDD